MSVVWADCDGPAHIGPIGGTLWRLVESQERIATTRLVDSLDEQAALEELIETTKPPLPGARSAHYLLRTPFRYPPLAHGSRFGSRFEPSLFYGSLTQPPMLAEAAYYRFLFWSGMSVPPASSLTSQHTAFSARYRSERGLRLQDPAFAAHRAALAHRADYAVTQALGAAMRDAGVEAVEYLSARDPDGGLNVALFTPRALASPRPLAQERWLCQTGGEQVQFLNESTRAVHSFALAQFLVDGRLPLAAA